MESESIETNRDNKIKQTAKNIILEICDKEELKDNENFKIVINESGEVEFRFNFSAKEGKAEINYTLQPYIENLLRNFFTQNEKLKNKGGFLHNLIPEYFRDFIRQVVATTVRIMIYNFQTECFGFVIGQAVFAKECFDYLNPILYDRNSEGILTRTDTERKEQINRIIEKTFGHKRKVILNLERQFLNEVTAPQVVFCDVYDDIYKDWKQAKCFYNANKSFGNILELVETAFPHLDKDLINKLSLRGESEPSELAYFSTGRMLNVPNHKLASDSTRKRYLADSRILRKKINPETAEEILFKYLDSQQNYDRKMHYWRDMALSRKNQSIK